jgi:hypothetical protein
MTLTDVRRTGAIALALAFVAQLFGNVIGNAEDESGGLAFFAITLVACVLLTAWLFGAVVPRAVEAGSATAARRALIVGVLALLAWGVFWSGLPFILGPAAVAMGVVSRARGGGGMATAAIVLGVIAVIASGGMVVGDELDLV